jgi:hypothetical protein
VLQIYFRQLQRMSCKFSNVFCNCYIITSRSVNPVPTAVPPRLLLISELRCFTASNHSLIVLHNQKFLTYCSGVASIRCVRPIFTTFLNSVAFACNVSLNFQHLKCNFCCFGSNVHSCWECSFDDCDLLTSLALMNCSPSPIANPLILEHGSQPLRWRSCCFGYLNQFAKLPMEFIV